jgi:hypothetical protein
MEFADTTIPTATTSYRTEDADTLKKFFQHNWVVIEVLTVSAAMPIRCFLCTKMHPAGHIHVVFYPIIFRESTKGKYLNEIIRK